MKVSRNWLQTFFDAPLPDAAKLAEALTFHAFEVESVEKKDNDDVLDVKVTPNRGHDCLSHRGIARELSAILGIPIVHDPFMAQELAGSFTMTSPVSVSIENSELCPRYIAWSITGVKVGPSPACLKERIESIGQRSINNVVDATNFVMFNIGQPLHAFDADTLKSDDKGHSIVIRNAKKGETMLSLDGKECVFTEAMLLIVDAVADQPIGIAGVKGGKSAEVGEKTSTIIIESANFNGVSVRRTARSLRLQTDASDRFQQVISPELAAHGMRAAAMLILEIAGGQLAGFADVYPKPQEKKSIAVFVPGYFNSMLGTKLFEADIIDALTRLGLPMEKKSGSLVVTAPFERLDLETSEDLAEEVARIIGYDKIPAVEMPISARSPRVNPNFYAAEREREELLEKGFSEVYTSVFAQKGERAVLNKVDGAGARPYLRENIYGELVAAAKKNAAHKDLLGISEVKLFEIGAVWSEGKELIKVATASEGKKDVAHTEHTLQPAEAAHYDQLPFSTTQEYHAFSRFPCIVRDIALWVPKETKSESVLEVIREHAGDLLVRSALFDEYEKNGKTSFAFRLIFQSFEKTLTDEEVNDQMALIYQALRKLNWEVR